MSRSDVLIIDGRNLLWRNADAFSDLSATVEGEEISTGGMYGFVLGCIRIHARYGGRMFIAWEGTGNFRYDLFPDYKKRGERTPAQKELAEEVHANEGRLIELLSAAGTRQFMGVGCEADDVMGVIASRVKGKGKRVTIYTGDSDLRQLVNKRIRVASPGRGGDGDTIFGPKAVKGKHGVVPGSLPHLKALSGDSSDGIPGLPGIGEKTARALIGRYRTIPGVIFGARNNDEDWPVAERFKSIVIDNRKAAILYLKLTTIDTQAGIKAIPIVANRKEVVRLLTAYKFRSLSAAAELMGIMGFGR